MPQNTKREAHRESKQTNDRAMWTTMAVLSVVLAIGAYHLVRDPVDFRESERQRVVDLIEQFREQHGAYPKDREQVRPFVSDTFSLGEYSATDDEFAIELTRTRFFPPGQRMWTFSSKGREWHYGSETW